MNENKTFFKKQKSYPVNSRASNRYINYNNNNLNNFYTQINNNFSPNGYNNLYIDDNILNTNRKMNNINLYHFTDNNNKINLDINQGLQKENNYLRYSLDKLKNNSNLKDIEINKYKKKIISLLNCVKMKNNELNMKNKLLSILNNEQDIRQILNENENNNINILSLSANKLTKYKQKNEELKNKMNYFLTERKNLFNYINKIKSDNIKIKKENDEKDAKMKSLINFYKRKNINISPNKNNSSDNFYNQMQIISPNKELNNKNYVTKNYFTIKNKVYNTTGKNNFDNNKLLNSYKELKIQKNEIEKKLFLKEKMINDLLKKINDLQKIKVIDAPNIDDGKLKNNNNKLKITTFFLNIFKYNKESNEKILEKKDEFIKDLENDNKRLKRELNELKVKYNNLSVDNQEYKQNKEKLVEEKEETIKKLENDNKILIKEINELKAKHENLQLIQEEIIENSENKLGELKTKYEKLLLEKEEEKIKNSKTLKNELDKISSKYNDSLLAKEKIINDSENTNEELKQKLIEIKSNYEQSILLKEDKINNLENSNKELEKQLNEIKIKYMELISKEQNKEDNIKELLTKITSNEIEIKERNEKINILSNNLTKANESINSYKIKISELEQIIKNKDIEINKKDEEIENNKVKNEEYINNFNNKEIVFKKEIDKKDNENKTLKNNFLQLKNEFDKVNNLRINDFNNINKLYKNLQISKEENNNLTNQNLELIEKIKTIEESNKIKYNEIKTENDNLNKIISQLNENLTKSNEELKSLILKNEENEKTLKEKELEIKNLEDVSRALLDKQKNYLEEKDKNEYISPDTHYIISKKVYNQLTWYLVSIFNPNDKTISNDKINNYNNYKWVTGLIISKNQLKKYNVIENGESQQSEQKEEKLYNLNINNKKLKDKNQNKSTSVKDKKILFGKFNDNGDKFQLNKSNSNKTVINIENRHNDEENSLISKIINYYENRELDYEKKISELEAQIRNTEELQLQTNSIKGISIENESDFIDFNISGGENMIKYLKEKKILKKKDKDDDEDILNDIPGNESALDEVKGLQFMNKYLKKDNKEKDKKFYNLSQKVEELIKNLNYDSKMNPQISEILQLIGYSQDKIENIIKNKILDKNKS